MRIVVASALMLLAGCEQEELPLAEDSGVEVPQTIVLSLYPPRGGQGTTMNVQVNSNLPRFVFGDSGLALGEGITVDSVTVLDEWTLDAEIAIAEDAALGFRDATVTVEDSTYDLPESFRVVAEGLVVTPDNGRMGELLEVELHGSGTTWEPGNTWASFGEGVEVRWVEVHDETSATATIAIAPDAVPGTRDVHAEDPPDVVTAWDGFTVDRAVLSAVCRAEPLLTGTVGGLRVDALGDLLHPSMTVELWDDGGLANDTFLEDVIVGDPTWMEANVRVSNAARPGTRDLYVQVGDERFVVPDCLTIEQAPINPMSVRGYTYFIVSRDISPTSGSISEVVSAYAQFYIPLDPPCFGGGGSGSGFPIPYDVNGVWPNPTAGDPADCPSVRMVSAGEHVWFESDRNIVTLDRRVRPARNQIWYTGRDLTLVDYVFDNLYDLRLEGDPDGLPAALVEDVQPTVPVDYDILAPDFARLIHPRSEPLDFEWTPAQSYPDGQFRVFVYGVLQDGRGGFGGIIPWDDGKHRWTSNNLSEFQEGPLEWRFESRLSGPRWALPFSDPPQYTRSFTAVRYDASMVLE
ncbi:MAG: hypothetical protein EP330_01160 [Deltaproteobacteria bacterium]|nr:MAG: hypothetical protein EP330_01160 [Deltaproteobacteria bacterium]